MERIRLFVSYSGAWCYGYEVDEHTKKDLSWDYIDKHKRCKGAVWQSLTAYEFYNLSQQTQTTNENRNEPEFNDDDDDFEPCCECDGHDACADFGCAIKAGLGHLVKRPY